MKQELIFIYNADSGIFNAMADLAHKIFSPQTYACNLCALTYSNTGMRREWKQFIEELGRTVSFLHHDELIQQYGIDNVELPAVFIKDDQEPQLWINADQLNACRTISELKDLITLKLKQPEPLRFT